MKKVLITSFGSNTSIGVSKCLRDYFQIFGIDTNPYFRCNGYEFAEKTIQVPNYNSDDYLAEINNIISKNGIDCIIPIHDKELYVLAKANDENQINCQIAINKHSIIDICNDKTKINKYLNNFIKVPVVFDNISNIVFPVIIKENDGVSSRNQQVIYTNEEMNIVDISNMIIQEYIADGIEYTVDCYTSYIDNNIFYYSVRERIETKSGISTKSQIVVNNELGDLCRIIHEKMKYVGVSNIQFVEKSGEYYFIEINPRFAGGGILTYKSGYNFPLITVKELCTNEVVEKLNLQIGNKMVRYYNETFFDEENNFIRLG